MLPEVGFDDEEWPSGVRPRVPAANYRRELAGWFGGVQGTISPSPLRAVGTSEATPASQVTPAKEWGEEPASGRIPFLIF